MSIVTLTQEEYRELLSCKIKLDTISNYVNNIDTEKQINGNVIRTILKNNSKGRENNDIQKD